MGRLFLPASHAPLNARGAYSDCDNSGFIVGIVLLIVVSTALIVFLLISAHRKDKDEELADFQHRNTISSLEQKISDLQSNNSTLQGNFLGLLISLRQARRERDQSVAELRRMTEVFHAVCPRYTNADYTLSHDDHDETTPAPLSISGEKLQQAATHSTTKSNDIESHNIHEKQRQDTARFSDSHRVTYHSTESLDYSNNEVVIRDEEEGGDKDQHLNEILYESKVDSDSAHTYSPMKNTRYSSEVSMTGSTRNKKEHHSVAPSLRIELDRDTKGNNNVGYGGDAVISQAEAISIDHVRAPEATDWYESRLSKVMKAC